MSATVAMSLSQTGMPAAARASTGARSFSSRLATTRSGASASTRAGSVPLVPPTMALRAFQPAGWTQKRVRPTVSASRPRAARASVRLGTSETMRVGRAGGGGPSQTGAGMVGGATAGRS